MKTAFAVLFYAFIITTGQLKSQTGSTLRFTGIENGSASPFTFTANWSAEAWINPAATGGGWYTVMSQDYWDQPSGWAVRIYQGFVGLETPQGFSIDATITANIWTHVAVTYSNGIYAFYKNGTLVGVSTNTIPFTNAPLNFHLGCRNNNNGVGLIDTYVGSIDEVRLWSVARTQCEIQTYMNCEIPGSFPGLTANYHFNQGTASGNNIAISTLTDASGNNNNISLSAFAMIGSTSNFITPGGVVNNFTTSVTPQAEIDVIGNGQSIPDGTTSTSLVNHTDFGAVTTRTFYVFNTGTTTLNISNPILKGLNANEFTVTALPSTSVLAALTGSTSFEVSFLPYNGGAKAATVVLYNNDCSEPIYSFPITATATGGAALNTDVANNYVAVNGHTLNNTAFTIEFWAKRNSTISGDFIYGQGTNTNNDGLHIGFYDQGVGNYFLMGFWNNDLVVNFSDFNWHHWACVYDPSGTNKNRFIYRDGILVGSDLATSPYTGTGVSYIGNTPWGVNFADNFNGTIDELRVWTTARNQCQIQTYMNCEISGGQAGLVGNYHFNEGVATIANTHSVVTDDSGLSNDGLLVNFNLTGTSSNWVANGAITSGYTLTSPPTASIAFSGNSNNIANNTAPSTLNLTNFNGANTRTFVLSNVGTSTLLLNAGYFTGPDASSFSVTTIPVTSVNASSSASFVVSFTPAFSGLHNATLNVVSNDCTYPVFSIPMSATTTAGSALALDGVNDNASRPQINTGIMDITLAARMKMTAPSATNGVIVYNGNTSSSGYGFFVPTGTQELDVLFGGNLIFSTNYTLQLNQWTSAVLVVNSQLETFVYVNGVMTYSSNQVWANAPFGNFVVGSNDQQSELFQGEVDEVQLWNRALSPCEIQSYTSCEVSSSASLLANYHFNQGIAGGTNTLITQVTDASGNNNHLTLNNVALTGFNSNFVSPGALVNGSSCAVYTEGDISITGNGNPIIKGTITPSLSDDTDWGNASLFSNFTHTFLITNSGTGSLTVSSFSLSGPDAVLFSISPPGGNTIAPSASMVFSVTFSPLTTGIKIATVHVISNDCDESDFDFAISADASGGDALDFDGVNDYINCGNILPASYTKECWIKFVPSATGNNYLSAGSGIQGSAFWAPGLYSDKLSAGHDGAWNQVQDPTSLSVGNWYHIAVTYDAPSTTMKLYTNGVLVSSNNTVQPFTGTNALNIGAFNGSFNANGKMDEVRIWNRALCQSEIQNNMNCEVSGAAPGLVASYHFNQGIGNGQNALVNLALDGSGANNTGTLTGFALNGTSSNWMPGSNVISNSSCNLISVPEIAVTGSVQTIQAGTYTVSAINGTQFGTTCVNAPVVMTYTIQNSGAGPLTVNTVSITGVSAASYSLGALSPAPPVTASSQAVFSVTFEPLTAGIHDATLSIVNDDCDEGNFEFAISGTGLSLPAVSVTASSPSVCPGNTVVLSGSGAQTYTWTGGVTDGIAFTPTATTTYSLTGTDLSGCTSTNVAAVTITVNPVIAITGNGNSVPSGAATSTTNNTDFGTATSRTFSISNAGPGTLTLGTIFFTGPNAGAFSVTTLPASSITAGSTGMVITLTPTNAGISTATVNIPSNDCSAGTYTFVITASVSPASALNFDGANDVILLSGSAAVPTGNSPYTIEAWIKTNTDGNLGIVGWGNYGNANEVNAFRLGTTGVLINYWWGNDLVVSAPSLTNGAWHHVAAAFDGTMRVIYIDGVMSGADFPSGHNVPNASNLAVGLTCNGVCSGGPEYFNGSLDEVRVWNVGRTQCQIQQFMNAEIPTTAPGLVINYHFNQGVPGGNNIAVITATDAAGANTGTLQGFGLSGNTSNWISPGAITNGFTTTAAPAVTLAVTGNGNTIPAGSTTPTVSNNTSFGNLCVNSGTISNTYSITNSGPGTLAIGPVGIFGSTAFTLGSTPFSLAGNSSTTFSITYSAGTTSVTDSGTVIIYSNDCVTPIYSFVISATVNALPTVTATASSPTVCQGGSVTLTGSGAQTYTWTGGVTDGVAFAPNLTNTYTLTGTNSAGCTNTNLAVVTVSVLPVLALTGNGNPVPVGITTSTTNNTDFGSSTSQSFSITNAGPGTLTVGAISFTGPNAGAFSVTTSPAASVTAGSTGFVITLTPTNTGISTATVNIPTNDCTNPTYSFVITASTSPASAMEFDGIDDKVLVPTNTAIPIGNSPYTIESWIKPGIGAQGIVGWGQYGAPNQSTGLLISGTNIHHIWWLVDMIVSAPTLTNGSWHHIAATYDGTVRATYLDGNLIGSDVPGVHNAANPNGVEIGSFYFSQVWKGTLDEMRIWNVARTQCQLQQFMNAEITSTASGLVANYHFNQGIPSGNNIVFPYNTVVDATGNGNAVTSNMSLTGTVSNWVSPGAVANGFTTVTIPSATLNAFGNGNSIPAGATTPTVSNNTDFGNLCVNTGTVSRTFSVTNSGTTTLNFGPKTISGSTLFTIGTLPSSLAASASATFPITYSTGTGSVASTATVLLYSNDCATPVYSFVISATVNPVPTVTATASTPTICPGGSVTLTGSGAQTYTWTGGVTNGISFTPTVTSSYTLSGSNAAGCTNTNIAVATVSVLPVLTLSGNGNSVPVGVTTSTANNTDFGLATTKTFSISNGGPGTLTLGPIFFTGPDAASFSVTTAPASAISSGSTGFVITLTPTNTGISTATVNIPSNDCSIPNYSFVVTASTSPASALNFDGTSDYVTVSPNAAFDFTAGTVEAWLNGTGVNANSTFACLRSGFTARWSLHYNVFTNNIYVWNSTSVVPIPVPLSANTWFHVAVLLSPSSSTLFVNGVYAGTTSIGINTANSGLPLSIGYNTNPGEYFSGKIDELRIWNTLRTQCEIQQFMNCEIPTTAPGLVANYHFNQGVPSGSNNVLPFNTLTDAAGANTGTLNTFALTGSVSNWVSNGAVANGFTTSAAPGATASLFGNNVPIPAGSTTPTITNNTSFGNFCVNAGVVSRTFSISNSGTTSLSISTGTITGSTGFTLGTLPTSLAASASGTFPITFSVGSTSGTSSSTVYISSNDCATPVYSFVISATVNAPPVVSGSASSTSVCPGGTLTLNGSGASTYTWTASTGTNPVDGVAFTPTANTSYSVTGTSTAGCTSTNISVQTITILPTPSISLSSSTLQLCVGGTATLTPAGAGTYTLLNGPVSGTTFTVAPSTSTGYSVAGTSTAGCQSTLSAISNITVFTLPVISVNSGTICAGSTFTLIPSGANTYTVASPNSLTVSPNITTSYTVTGTSTAGCTSTIGAIGTVSVFTLPSITVNSGTTCVGSVFTMTPGGAASYTFSNGSSTVVPASSGTFTYGVTGTSTAGCVSATNAISSLTASPLPVISMAGATLCTGQTVTLNPQGAQSFTFLAGGPAVSPTTTTAYTVTGTSTAGCVSPTNAVATVTVYNTPVIAVNSGTLCAGTVFTLTPSGANTYTISGPNTLTVNPGSNASYTVTGTSTAGCVSTLSAVSNLTVFNLPLITVNSGTICAGSVFTMVPGGASTYSYSSNSATVSPASTTTFAVAGTSTAGCVSTTSAISTVSVFANPTVAVTGGTLCTGLSFTLNPGGAASFTYVNGGPVVSPTITTTYSIIGSSTAGCISPASGTAAVTVFSVPVITVNSGSICQGGNFTLTPGGAFTYTIAPGNTTTVTPTVTTTYSITGTAANGCSTATTALGTVSVNINPTITVNSGSICSGQVFTIVPTGAANYTFSSGASTVSPLTTTSYSVSGSSTAGCTSTAQAVCSVTVDTTPTITVNSGSICAGQIFTIQPAGASTYSIQGGTATVSPASSTNYTVTGFSPGGCQSNLLTSSLTVYGLPTVNISLSSASVCAGSSVVATATGAVSYTWIPAISNGSAFVPASTSNYTVTGEDLNGCQNTNTTGIVVHPLPSLTVTSTSSLSCEAESVTLTVQGAKTYSWSNTATDSVIVVTPIATLVFTVTGEFTTGCVSTASITQNVTVCPFTFSANPSFSNVTCFRKKDGSIVLNPEISYPNKTVKYIWNNNACPDNNCDQADSLDKGNYTVMIKVTYTINNVLTKEDSLLVGPITITDINPPCDLEVFNGVSPNNDGVNDFLQIRNIEQYPLNKLTIFNRWGQVVKEIPGYDNKSRKWPANNDLDGLPAATYFFVLDPGEGAGLLKGWIELVR